MRKLVLVPLALVLVVLAISGASKPARACQAFCDTSTVDTTPIASAIGTSCTNAQTNLTAQLRSYAESYSACNGPSCNFNVTITTACYAISGGYSISGYATFSCRDSTC